MNFHGKTVVLADAGREDLADRLRALGARVTDSLEEPADLWCGSEPDEDVWRLGIPMLTEADLYELLLRGTPEPGPGDFPGAGVPGGEPERVHAVLRAADWAAFVPERDLPPLRETLTALERAHGVTPAHLLATERLVERGARLRHPYARPAFGVTGAITGFALSPSGRHLATGHWHMEEERGTLQIWELATGRAVNAVAGIEGGVGWPGCVDTVQWSADGSRLALAFRTNMVGVWDPFGAWLNPYGEANVTDGNDSAATFALAPDGRSAYISMRSDHEVMGCVAALDQGHVFFAAQFGDVEGPLPELLPEPIPGEMKSRLDDGEWFFDQVWYSRDGKRLLGHDHDFACAVELPGGRMLWLAETGGPAVWSPDERLVAAVGNGRLVVLDANTGHEIGSHPVAGAPYWGMRGDVPRLAVVMEDGAGVGIHDEHGGFRYHLGIETIDGTGADPHSGQELPWAWAPSGEHGACLTSGGRVEVWSLGAEPELVRSAEAPDEATAVFWGDGDVLALAGERALRFVRAMTGEVLGDFVFDLECDVEPPVEEDALLDDVFGADSFVLDEEAWCTIAAPAVGPAAGLVIVPGDRLAELDADLAWTVERRFAWPVRWGRLDVVPDAESARATLERASEEL
ncbi:hypothetical protein SAMN05444920_107136 [Nonomuraea solani]|uniref:Uncharacterized protein n=1 Tax=Nonomuraea solani TaxID=1144553 RepID=A0A1H6E0J8_9ACTN|nr:hypothetical protein [Nonomuraea solani]SEG90899.1 hypothetical protein SAMN05444920_107136 [Nonomuraea solani]